MTQLLFPSPTRRAALDRLMQFAPKAGPAYTLGRNTDQGPDQLGAVSRLSPYLRYRLITEQDVIERILDRHGLKNAQKFVQEVCWRTYWKGWLEMRPAIWRRFLAERAAAREPSAGSTALDHAEQGRTGIDAFDAWVNELKATGYLHNHARMWFASIWIFTLRLPWTLGADFFLRHLIDADAASNTLSWRWVAGLQTPGKIYLARADNIARHTEGRFVPRGLAMEGTALTEPPIQPAGPLPAPAAPDLSVPSLLLLHHEDLNPETFVPAGAPLRGIIGIADPALLWGEGASRFVQPALGDARERAAAHFGCSAKAGSALDPDALLAAAQAAGVCQIVTAYAPIGPVADALAQAAPKLANAGVALCQVRRPWDTQLWPHARRGFFAFEAQIEAHLRADGLI